MWFVLLPCMWVEGFCACLSSSDMSILVKSWCPLRPDCCSLNKEEWPWIFPSCTHTHHHSVLQRTPDIPILSGETPLLCSSSQSVLGHFSSAACHRVTAQRINIEMRDLPLLCLVSLFESCVLVEQRGFPLKSVFYFTVSIFIISGDYCFAE